MQTVRVMVFYDGNYFKQGQLYCVPPVSRHEFVGH
jgi:hypothetical protein